MADSNQQGVYTELARFYRSLLPKPATTITFFDRGDFYSIIGQDALFVSKDILHRASNELKEASVSTSDSQPLEYININKVQFEVVISELLLVHLYRVEVYDCKSWKVTYKGSPGNISQFEDVLSNSADSGHSFGVAALAVSSADNTLTVGIAMADQTSRNFVVSEFIDNDRFSNLEAALVQLSPKECLIPAGEATPRVVRDILERVNCLVTERRKAEFSVKDISQDLGRLLKHKSDVAVEAWPEMQKQKGISCLSALIKYLEFMSDECNFGKFILSTFDLTQYVKLDAAAVRALNLIPNPTDSREQSLLGILDQCKTGQGHRLLKQWIKQPLIDINKINERLGLVEIFFTDQVLRQSVHEEHLAAIPDFQKLAKKLAIEKATLQDCYRIYQALTRLPLLDTSLEEYEGVNKELLRQIFLNDLKELMLDLNKFSGLIDEVLDMDTVDSLEFRVKPDFDEGLAEIGHRMKELESLMSKQLTKAASELGLEAGKTIKLESNSHLGHFFRLTRKDEKVLRSNKNYETLDTKKDGVRFTSRSLSKYNSEYVDLRKQYQQLQSDVLKEIMKVAGGYAEPVYRLGDLIALLDVIVSLATASSNATIPYVKPTLLPQGSGQTDLKDIRHPCLEAMDIDFIPNDCMFDKEDSLFHIITGPNMGGKSTYIRSVAMAVLMAQIGCYVPCSAATISAVDSIMARVGAGDSQLKGVSTFMAEMLESSAILKAATPSSLIVIDELGRGTSTYDGFGLAWAISHYIATEIKCFTLFATHFHELTTLAEEIPFVKNVHVSAMTQDGELTLLYKVLPGVCDGSFGLHVARIVKFPQRVLEYAERKSLELEDTACSLDGKTEAPMELDTENKKNLKRERDESHELLQEYIKRLKSECSQANDTDILASVEQIRNDISESHNSFLKSVATF